MSQCLVINGGKKLRGEVVIGGAKNAVLKLMAASLLVNGVSVLHNVPDLTDVETMSEVLRYTGAKVTWNKVEKSMEIDASCVDNTVAPYDLVSKMRGSFIVAGALLSRFGEAKVALPGGCAIGERRVDYHIKGFEALGAEASLDGGYVLVKAKRLHGADICLDKPSVGATENLMLASVLAEGSTSIRNAAQEPEIVDLANFLNLMGADITGAGTSEIVVNGVDKSALHSVVYTTMPDRIEAGTYMTAIVATRGRAIIRNIFPNHLTFVTNKLIEAGANISLIEPFTLEVSMNRRPSAINIVTQPYPGFPTDMQSQFLAALATAQGVSVVTENLYENRFMQLTELLRMGADVRQEGNSAIINGVEKIKAAHLRASDLRAGGSLVVAALSAEGQSVIENVYHIDRGYEKIIEKFSGLGAEIKRIDVTDVQELIKTI
ncbi:MAG: UDP-N-acetylglucosamine 1-carboxyvinyltransferase [Candidatus Gastranaerophilales bacterium]|nr:UDP-N-acetylglucosamine 1-carboxyvinyltransferase [Candidatus Gastranaerophilales bacterium]